LAEWANIVPFNAGSEDAPRPALHFYVPSTKSRKKQKKRAWSTATCCMCAGYDASHRERAELRRLCPVCSLRRWHRVAPDSRFVSTLPSGKPFLRDAFNRELRRALRIALGDHPLADDIVRRLAAKSFRSGACTVLVTAGTADMVAADFLGHSDPKITQAYYNRAGDAQRLHAAQPLATALRR
jgi:integrase